MEHKISLPNSNATKKEKKRTQIKRAGNGCSAVIFVLYVLSLRNQYLVLLERRKKNQLYLMD